MSAVSPATELLVPPDLPASENPLESEVRALEVRLASLEERRSSAVRRRAASDPDSEVGRAALALAHELAEDIIRDGRAASRDALRAAESAAAARVAVAVRDAHEILVDARLDLTSALDERAAFAETILATPPAELPGLLGSTSSAPATRLAEAIHSTLGDEVVIDLVEPAAVEPTAVAEEPVGSSPEGPTAEVRTELAHLPDPPAVGVRPDVAVAPAPALDPDAAIGHDDHATEATLGYEELADLETEDDEERPAPPAAIEDRSTAFWREQEGARSQAWLRPLEIVVPLLAAALIVVLLLLFWG